MFFSVDCFLSFIKMACYCLWWSASCFFPLSITFLRFIQVFVSRYSSFIFMYVCHTPFSYPWVLGGFSVFLLPTVCYASSHSRSPAAHEQEFLWDGYLGVGELGTCFTRQYQFTFHTGFPIYSLICNTDEFPLSTASPMRGIGRLVLSTSKCKMADLCGEWGDVRVCT